MTIALAVLIFAGLVHALRIRGRVAGHQRLRLARAGWVSCEVWRRASLVAHVDVTGRKTFPLPQETRTRIWRCIGIPLRCKVESLGLPAQVTDTIDGVTATQFDALFSSAYRCTPQDPAAKKRTRGMAWAHLSRL